MNKLTVQLELKLQGKMIPALQNQGWFATKTSDRFKAGRPDLRISREDLGQMDVELKYSLSDFSKEDDTGLTKLQWIKIKEMNAHGMPAVGLVYSEPLDLFFVTSFLRDTLPPVERRVVKLPGNKIINGEALFVTVMEFLNETGQYKNPRDWRTARPSGRAQR